MATKILLQCTYGYLSEIVTRVEIEEQFLSNVHVPKHLNPEEIGLFNRTDIVDLHVGSNTSSMINFPSMCNESEVREFANCLGCIDAEDNTTLDGNVITNIICPLNVTAYYEVCPNCLNCYPVVNSDLFNWTFLGHWIILALAVMGIVANLGSLCAIHQFKKSFVKKYKPFHTYIFNLSCSDVFLSCALCAYILQGLLIRDMSSVYYNSFCVERVSKYIVNILMISTFLSNALIVLNLYMSVEFAFKYKQIVTKTFVRGSIAFGWLLCLLPWGLVYIVSMVDTDSFSVGPSYFYPTWCKMFVQGDFISGDKIIESINIIGFMYIIQGVLLFLLLITIIPAYLRIRHVVKKSGESAGNPESHKKNNLKLNITMLFLNGSLIALWVPVILATMVESRVDTTSANMRTDAHFTSMVTLGTQVNTGSSVTTSFIVSTLTSFCMTISCLVDPVIYGWRIQEVREGYKVLFKGIYGLIVNLNQ